MKVPDGFEVKLFASEPEIRQPLTMSFDERGRMWVVQYLQYPTPAGLKPVSVDQYLRTKYDRVPEPPPRGPKGADRITICEDTDGDGRADRFKDFVSDLNLASGLALGHGGVFVAQPPYLLFYPDRNRDDIPDSDPEVLLTGFGMEDSHAFANSLTWGPDGWLYGAHGSTVTANIRGIEFQQGIWRYHPVTRQFELFAEGGGNTWGLDFDEHGNIIAGTNFGEKIGLHQVQGGYYVKGFAKHGPLHNPHTFGYFDHIPYTGFKGGHVTCGGIVYQGGSFPTQFNGTYIAANLLANAVYWHVLEHDGSSFKGYFGGELLTTDDIEFRPVDLTVGPDGSVFVADWCDKRATHVDSVDTWDRSNGRIYKVEWKGSARGRRASAGGSPARPSDLRTLPSEELVKLLAHQNDWFRREARRLLAERREPKIVSILGKEVLAAKDERLALQSLWTLSVCGGFDESVAAKLLTHANADVRSWTIRLLGDNIIEVGPAGRRPVSVPTQRRQAGRLPDTLDEPAPSPLPSPPTGERVADLSAVALAKAEGRGRGQFPVPMHTKDGVRALHAQLISLARNDASPTVRNQLACTAKRLPAKEALPVIRELMQRDEDVNDPQIPLLIWWAIEAKAISDRLQVVELFSSPPMWRRPLVQKHIVERVSRRYAVEGTDEGFDACAQLLTLAPNSEGVEQVLKGIELALEGRRLEKVPASLESWFAKAWKEKEPSLNLVCLGLRIGSREAGEVALSRAVDERVSEVDRAALMEGLGQVGKQRSVPVLVQILELSKSTRLQNAALSALQRFGDPQVARSLLEVYPRLGSELRSRTRNALCSRRAWAVALIDAIEAGRMAPSELGFDQLRQVVALKDDTLTKRVEERWGKIQSESAEEKQNSINRLRLVLKPSGAAGRNGKGDPAVGKPIFQQNCGICHRLFGEGNMIGPDLTGADRKNTELMLVSIVDPNAYIRPEYMGYEVVTKDDQQLSGLLVESSPTTVTILDRNNQRHLLARDKIKELSQSTVSLMPEGLLEAMTPQQVMDLFAYLQSAGPIAVEKNDR